MKTCTNHIIFGISCCIVLMKTCILSIEIGDVFKNWVKIRVKYLCKYRISENKITPTIPLAVRVRITYQS